MTGVTEEIFLSCDSKNVHLLETWEESYILRQPTVEDHAGSNLCMSNPITDTRRDEAMQAFNIDDIHVLQSTS